MRRILLGVVVLAVGLAAVSLFTERSAAADWPHPFCLTRGVAGTAPSCDAALAGKFPDLTKANQVTFAVIGDMGTGEPEQRVVGAALAATCKTEGCRFVIAVGDNLYDGPKTTEDPRFQTWFREPYAGLDVPVWLSLGNHDWYGEPQAEIDYTALAAKETKGPYWFMPGPIFTVPGLPPWLDLVAIDTQTIVQGPEAGKQAQVALLNAALPKDASSALTRWSLVYGHHPWRSSGAHGDTKAVSEFLAPWLNGTTIDAAFFGHDHHQEHYDAGNAQLFIQGATAQTRSIAFDPKTRHCKTAEQRDCSRWAALQVGFTIVRVKADALTVKHYTVGTPSQPGPTQVAYTYAVGRAALASRQAPKGN